MQSIVTAIVAGIPVCLVGAPGTGKTVGPRALALSLFGAECKFRDYYCPELTRDTLMGFLDMDAFRKKRVEFIGDDAIWKYEAVLLDEPTRAPAYMQAYIMELVRTRMLMGRSTALKLVMSAVNPPDLDPTATYMPLALSQRYVYAWAPDLETLLEPKAKKPTSDALRKALYSNLENEEKPLNDLSELMREAQSKLNSGWLYSDNILTEDALTEALRKTTSILLSDEVTYSIRQMKYVKRMLEALLCLHSCDGRVSLDKSHVWDLVHSTIPQWYGVVPTSQQLIKGNGAIQPPSSVIDRVHDSLAPLLEPTRKLHYSLSKIYNRAHETTDMMMYDAQMAELLNFAKETPVCDMLTPSGLKMIYEMSNSSDAIDRRVARLVKLRVAAERDPGKVIVLDDLVKDSLSSRPRIPSSDSRAWWDMNMTHDASNRICNVGRHLDEAAIKRAFSSFLSTANVLGPSSGANNINSMFVTVKENANTAIPDILFSQQPSSKTEHSVVLMIFFKRDASDNAGTSDKVAIVMYGPGGFGLNYTLTHYKGRKASVTSVSVMSPTSGATFEEHGMFSVFDFGTMKDIRNFYSLVAVVIDPTYADLSNLEIIDPLTALELK